MDQVPDDEVPDWDLDERDEFLWVVDGEARKHRREDTPKDIVLVEADE